MCHSWRSAGQLAATVVYTGPLAAGFAAGAPLAELVMTLPGMGERRIPLVAETAVGPAGFATRMITAGKLLYGDLTGDGSATTVGN